MAGQRAASVRHTTPVWLLSKVGAITVAAYLGILIVSLAAVRHLVAGPIAMPAWGVATQPPSQWARLDTFIHYAAAYKIATLYLTVPWVAARWRKSA